MSSSAQRNLYIDIAKGIGICFVVFAHNMQIYTVRAYLFPFTVHFFFFMAGYNFNFFRHRENPGNFIWTRFSRLLLPYLVACVCSYFLYAAMAPILSLPQISPGAAMDGITGGYIHDLEFNIVLWFLPALFFADIIFLALGYKLNGVYLFVAVTAVTTAGYILGRYDQQLIFSLDIAMTVQIFVYAGYLFRQTNSLQKVMQLAKGGFFNALVFVSVFLLLVSIVVYNANQVVPDIPTRVYGKPYLFFTAGISGSIILLVISFLISDVVHRYIGSVLAMIGRASLDILISHIPISFFIASVLALYWGTWVYDTSVHYWHVIFILGISIPALTHFFIANVLNKVIKPQNLFY